MKIRFKYEKNEEVKYIGHLDVMSMFDRVFRRANIAIEYSQGFHQRSQIIFALPSSVGVISKCEYFTVNIVDNITINEAVERLNNELPKGFKIIEGIEFPKDINIVLAVKEAKYRIVIESEMFKEIEQLFTQDTIYVTRIVRKNNVEYKMNIVPYINSIEIHKNGNDLINIYISIKAGADENLKPDYIIQALIEYKIDVSDYQIYKEEVIFE